MLPLRAVDVATNAADRRRSDILPAPPVCFTPDIFARDASLILFLIRWFAI